MDRVLHLCIELVPELAELLYTDLPSVRLIFSTLPVRLQQAVLVLKGLGPKATASLNGLWPDLSPQTQTQLLNQALVLHVFEAQSNPQKEKVTVQLASAFGSALQQLQRQSGVMVENLSWTLQSATCVPSWAVAARSQAKTKLAEGSSPRTPGAHIPLLQKGGVKHGKGAPRKPDSEHAAIRRWIGFLNIIVPTMTSLDAALVLGSSSAAWRKLETQSQSSPLLLQLAAALQLRPSLFGLAVQETGPKSADPDAPRPQHSPSHPPDPLQLALEPTLTPRTRTTVHGLTATGFRFITADPQNQIAILLLAALASLAFYVGHAPGCAAQLLYYGDLGQLQGSKAQKHWSASACWIPPHSTAILAEIDSVPSQELFQRLFINPQRVPVPESYKVHGTNPAVAVALALISLAHLHWSVPPKDPNTPNPSLPDPPSLHPLQVHWLGLMAQLGLCWTGHIGDQLRFWPTHLFYSFSGAFCPLPALRREIPKPTPTPPSESPQIHGPPDPLTQLLIDPTILQRGSLLVETNYSVCLQTQSPILVRLVNTFVEWRFIQPTIAFGQLTRSSFSRACQHGLNTQVLLRFLARYSPLQKLQEPRPFQKQKISAEQGSLHRQVVAADYEHGVPRVVQGQLRRWEIQVRRISCVPGCLLLTFPNPAAAHQWIAWLEGRNPHPKGSGHVQGHPVSKRSVGPSPKAPAKIRPGKQGSVPPPPPRRLRRLVWTSKHWPKDTTPESDGTKDPAGPVKQALTLPSSSVELDHHVSKDELLGGGLRPWTVSLQFPTTDPHSPGIGQRLPKTTHGLPATPTQPKIKLNLDELLGIRSQVIPTELGWRTSTTQDGPQTQCVVALTSQQEGVRRRVGRSLAKVARTVGGQVEGEL